MEWILVFLLRLGTAVYHVGRIILDLWMFVVTSMINRAFRSFQCAKNLYKHDPKEFLLSKLDEAKSYDEWHQISLQLDKMERLDKWRLEPESDLYDWKQLMEHLRRLREYRAKGDLRILKILLRISCNRNFCNLSSTELFGTSRVGTKQLIEEYENEVCEALKDMCLLFDELVNNLINLQDERMDMMDTIELNKYVLNHNKPKYSYPESYMLHWLPSICGALPYSRPIFNEKRKIPHDNNTRNLSQKTSFPASPGLRRIFSPIIKLKGRRKMQINEERKIKTLRNTRSNLICSDNWIDILSTKESSRHKGESRRNKRKNIDKRQMEQLHKVTKQVQTDESTFLTSIAYAVCDNSLSSVSHLSTPSNNLASTILSEQAEGFEDNEECFNETLQLEIENMSVDDCSACGTNFEFPNVDEKTCETDRTLNHEYIVDPGDSCIEECRIHSAPKSWFLYNNNDTMPLGESYKKSKIDNKLFENSGGAALLKLNENNSSVLKKKKLELEEEAEAGELKHKFGKNVFAKKNYKIFNNNHLLHDKKLLTFESKQKLLEEAHGRYNFSFSLNSLLSDTKASSLSSCLDLNSSTLLLSTPTDSVTSSSAFSGLDTKDDSSNVSISSPLLSCQSSPAFVSKKSFTSSYKNKFNLMQELRNFFTDMRLSMGRTALCLSGGGALAMYHIGVVKTLVEQGLLPRVISGASGGAIVAALLARYTDEELLSEILKPNISQRYGVRWFPPVIEQIKSFLTTGCMVDPVEFEKTCKTYFQGWTFSECLEKTGRLVSIVVTPAGRHHGEPLVLNCINTPDVLLWSAVAASCALPGLMPPSEIMSKNSQGEIVPYFPQGLKWIDGSIKSDIPQKELSCLFNIKEFIVSQVNPHATPFVKAHNSHGQFLRSIENWLTLDIKSRYSVLTQFNMVPKIFGQNISTFWMMQEFEGHVTITPRASFSDWYRLINHPSEEDMRHFICVGESRTWSHIPRIKHMLKIEQELRKCWSRIEASHARLRVFHTTSVLKQKKNFKDIKFYVQKD